MNVHSFAYDKFYEIIFSKWKSILSSDEKDKVGRNSADLWAVRRDGEYLFYKYFGDEHGTDLTRFHRLRGQIRQSYNGYGPVDTTLFIAGLHFIDIITPIEYDRSFFQAEDKVRVLYQLFLQREFPGFLERYPMFQVYDIKTNQLRYALLYDQPQVSNQILNFKGSVEFDDAIVAELSGHEQFIREVIANYFAYISSSRFVEAFDLWHMEMKVGYWENSLEKFSSSYYTNLRIESLHTMDLEISYNPGNGLTAECIVFFKEKVVAIDPSINLGYPTWPVKNWDEFQKRLSTKLKKASTDNNLYHITLNQSSGIKVFQQITTKMELPDFINLREQQKDKFASSLNRQVLRLYKFLFRRAKGIWYIYNIVTLRPHDLS